LYQVCCAFLDDNATSGHFLDDLTWSAPHKLMIWVERTAKVLSASLVPGWETQTASSVVRQILNGLRTLPADAQDVLRKKAQAIHAHSSFTKFTDLLSLSWNDLHNVLHQGAPEVDRLIASSKGEHKPQTAKRSFPPRHKVTDWDSSAVPGSSAPASTSSSTTTAGSSSSNQPSQGAHQRRVPTPYPKGKSGNGPDNRPKTNVAAKSTTQEPRPSGAASDPQNFILVKRVTGDDLSHLSLYPRDLLEFAHPGSFCANHGRRFRELEALWTSTVLKALTQGLLKKLIPLCCDWTSDPIIPKIVELLCPNRIFAIRNLTHAFFKLEVSTMFPHFNDGILGIWMVLLQLMHIRVTFPDSDLPILVAHYCSGLSPDLIRSDKLYKFPVENIHNRFLGQGSYACPDYLGQKCWFWMFNEEYMPRHYPNLPTSRGEPLLSALPAHRQLPPLPKETQPRRAFMVPRAESTSSSSHERSSDPPQHSVHNIQSQSLGTGVIAPPTPSPQAARHSLLEVIIPFFRDYLVGALIDSGSTINIITSALLADLREHLARQPRLGYEAIEPIDQDSDPSTVQALGSSIVLDQKVRIAFPLPGEAETVRWAEFYVWTPPTGSIAPFLCLLGRPFLGDFGFTHSVVSGGLDSVRSTFFEDRLSVQLTGDSKPLLLTERTTVPPHTVMEVTVRVVGVVTARHCLLVTPPVDTYFYVEPSYGLAQTIVDLKRRVITTLRRLPLHNPTDRSVTIDIDEPVGLLWQEPELYVQWRFYASLLPKFAQRPGSSVQGRRQPLFPKVELSHSATSLADHPRPRNFAASSSSYSHSRTPPQTPRRPIPPPNHPGRNRPRNPPPSSSRMGPLARRPIISRPDPISQALTMEVPPSVRVVRIVPNQAPSRKSSILPPPRGQPQSKTKKR
jgi:hypothetical protein